MGKETGIGWTNHTFNPWIGCTEVSAGCDHCYARVLDTRWGGGSHWGKGTPRKTMSDAYWKQPLSWDAAAKKEGKKALVFCASMADVMDDEAPDGQRERLWLVIDQTPNLIWQLLTKRPHRYERYLPAHFVHKNVWLGTTAEDQPNYDLRWPILYAAAKKRELITFISYEPALGPLRLGDSWFGEPRTPDWLIFGGESGPGRRPMERQWLEDIRRDTDASGTRLFVKQFSAHTPKEGAKLIPVELLIRELPEVTP